MLYEYHRIARTKEEAANQALLAGIDVELPSTIVMANRCVRLWKMVISMDTLMRWSRAFCDENHSWNL
jgi:hypothetical protein